MIRRVLALTLILLFLLPIIPLAPTRISVSDKIDSGIEYTVTLEECTSIIVTGSAAKDGRAILMKNRDSTQIRNIPVFHPATNETYAFVAVNSMWMGINEKGLAVMNTAMPQLSNTSDLGSINGLVNQRILARCANINDVLKQLRAKENPIIDTSLGIIASCIGYAAAGEILDIVGQC